MDGQTHTTNTTQQTAEPATGQTQTPAAPATIALESLDADLRGDKTLAGLVGQPLSKMARMLVEGQALLGRKGAILPKGPDDKEGMAAFRKAIGVPEGPDKYPAVTLPAGIEADPDTDKVLRGWAHDLGWTPDQYQGFVQRIVQHQATEAQNAQKAQAQALEEFRATLQTEWGSRYPYNVQLANTAVAAFAGPKEIEALKELGVLENPTFLRMMVKVGEAISPDRLHLRPDGATDVVSIQRQINDLMASDAYKTGMGKPHDDVLDQILALRERMTAAQGKQ